MRSILKWVLHSLGLVALTLLTQLGGVAYALAAFSPLKIGKTRPRAARFTIFAVAYTGLWLTALLVAPLFGRTSVACGFDRHHALKMQSIFYCAANRHYVTPNLKRVADGLAEHMDGSFPGAKTVALDANFPFFDGFPLLPHLSHDDGRKLDLAFYYKDLNGIPLPGKTRSPIGYWAFEHPNSEGEEPCSNGGLMRWDVAWFRPFVASHSLDEERLRTALSWLANEGVAMGVSKVFVEPHLVQRLGVRSPVIRFQGCHAARHDDHIHLQVVP